MSRALERRVEALESQKQLLTEKLSASAHPLRPFDEMYRTALDFLSNPLKIWRSSAFSDKRAVVRLVFPQRLTTVRNEGYRTPAIALPFKHFGDSFKRDMLMVPGSGSISNPDDPLLAQWNANNKGVSQTPEGALAPEVCDELFQTLEEWNDYLERYTSIFQDHGGPQP